MREQKRKGRSERRGTGIRVLWELKRSCMRSEDMEGGLEREKRVTEILSAVCPSMDPLVCRYSAQLICAFCGEGLQGMYTQT